ncbi:hypothetical protein NLI96_g4923 [Meripilus lineatus]|uniref:Glucose receptor Git3 N-terminal domain-containing protein n=1 Tax=Meripilus lineatus TaxID=2056292 RepID=A0AAD5YJG2_9APHY|nr:hypothetical protein NLI96_g4923 [Physisporinus lineatus]
MGFLSIRESSFTFGGPINYDKAHAGAIVSLVAAGGLSGFAVILAITLVAIRSPPYKGTHVVAYFLSLLFANVLQAVGTTMSARWALEHEVTAGTFCSFQGAIKQAGNLGMALWSFVLAVHLFNLLFMRRKSTDLGQYLTLLIGWFCVFFLVAIGPLAIKRKEKGAYFGPTGYWCWITHKYPLERAFLEYFFEFLSASSACVLYTAILLCVRGNIMRSNGRWRFRFVPPGQSWQLALCRDIIDTSMMRIVARMVWFPISYTILLLPISLARLMAFSGHKVPFWATILTGTIFNLQGLVNVIIWVCTRHLIPDINALPVFTTPRREIDLDSSEIHGITPYALPPSPIEPASESKETSEDLDGEDEKLHTVPLSALPLQTAGFLDDPEIGLNRSDSNVSYWTTNSSDSQNAMIPKPKWSAALRPTSWRR